MRFSRKCIVQKVLEGDLRFKIFLRGVRSINLFGSKVAYNSLTTTLWGEGS
jgi:hypothetical protein